MNCRDFDTSDIKPKKKYYKTFLPSLITTTKKNHDNDETLFILIFISWTEQAAAAFSSSYQWNGHCMQKNKATHLIVGTSEMLSPNDIYRRKPHTTVTIGPFFGWSHDEVNNPSLFKVLSCCLLRFDKRKTIPRTMSTTTDMCHALKCRKEHHDHDYH